MTTKRGKKNVSHNNRVKPEMAFAKNYGRSIPTVSMMAAIKKGIDEQGTSWIHMPEWSRRKEKGLEISSNLPLDDPKLVGLVTDIALNVRLNDAGVNSLQTFMGIINHYTGASTKTPIELKWSMPVKERNLALELVWQAKEYPDDDAINAIARLCLLTRRDLGEDSENPLTKRDIYQIKQMVNNAEKFFRTRRMGRRNCVITVPQNEKYQIKGTPDWLSSTELWELKSHKMRPLPKDYVQLLGYLALIREQSKLGYDFYTDLNMVGVYSSREDVAWFVPMSLINENDIDYVAYNILNLRKMGV